MWPNFEAFLAALFLVANILPLEAVPSALTRQLLIFHEPPVESTFKQADHVTEHYITQRLDNFNRQDPRTFQMVHSYLVFQKLNEWKSHFHFTCCWWNLFFNLICFGFICFFSAIWKMMFILKVADPCSSWSEVNGKSGPAISQLDSWCTIWQRNPKAYCFILSIDIMAKHDQPSKK